MRRLSITSLFITSALISARVRVNERLRRVSKNTFYSLLANTPFANGKCACVFLCVCVAFASCVLVIELAELAFATFQRFHYKRDMTYNSYLVVSI